jgi:hypothetical protein
LTAVFGAGEPPKRPPNAGAGFLATGTGAGAGSTLGACLAAPPPNKLNVPLPLGAGLLTGAGMGAGGALGAAFLRADPPKRESVGDGLRTGAGFGASGLTSTFFAAAGLLPKRLNGSGFGLVTSATGSGFGGATGVGALFPAPKKEFSASVIALGAMSMSLTDFFGGAETFEASGAALGFGLSSAGWKKEKGDEAASFFSTLTSALTGAGGAGFVGAAGLTG